jgi:hypothetical protein
MTDDREREIGAGNLRAWILLFGAFAAGAGHGLFLYVRTARGGWLPDFAQLDQTAGTLGTAVIAWFMASLPLAILVGLLRRPLQRQGWLLPVALAAAACAAGAFVFYARWIAGEPA